MLTRPAIAACVVLTLVARPATALTQDEQRHLLSRTGFGVEVASLVTSPRDYPSAVDALLTATTAAAHTPPPAWVDQPPPGRAHMAQMSETERQAWRRKGRRQALDLKAWWYREMIATPSALTERMTLFWHNHFTSSLRKVRWPAALYEQNRLLRQHALGNFRELLHEIARDPAMIVYLDTQASRKAMPNENFARELLELFTLGEGHYTEQDIKEAARAFTGWSVNRRTGRFRYRAGIADTGEKHFLGRSGRFNGDDILEILLDTPRTAEHITAILWREFITAEPPPGEITRLARLFRDQHYQIKPLLRAILLSDSFRNWREYGAAVKSPVELLVGTVRAFHRPVPDPRLLARAGRYLGQDLFDPPNVKGWPGGQSWINANTLLARAHVLSRLMRGMRREGMLPPASAEQWRQALLPLAPVDGATYDGNILAYLGQLVHDPVYQLK